jgi:hypothetical protein
MRTTALFRPNGEIVRRRRRRFAAFPSSGVATPLFGRSSAAVRGPWRGVADVAPIDTAEREGKTSDSASEADSREDVMSSAHAGQPCQRAIVPVAHHGRLLVQKMGIQDAILGVSASHGILSSLDIHIQRSIRRTRSARPFGRVPPVAPGGFDALDILEEQEALVNALAGLMRSGRFCLGNQIFPIDFGGAWITVREQAIRDVVFERCVRWTELRHS